MLAVDLSLNHVEHELHGTNVGEVLGQSLHEDAVALAHILHEVDAFVVYLGVVEHANAIRKGGGVGVYDEREKVSCEEEQGRCIPLAREFLDGNDAVQTYCCKNIVSDKVQITAHNLHPLSLATQ